MFGGLIAGLNEDKWEETDVASKSSGNQGNFDVLGYKIFGVLLHSIYGIEMIFGNFKKKPFFHFAKFDLILELYTN